MKASFYGHFVAGEDQEAIKPVISNLEKFGVGAILDYSVEEDLSENETKGHMGKNPDESLDPADEHAQYKPHVEFADRRKGVYSARTYFYEGEEECDMRVNTFLKCIDAAGINIDVCIDTLMFSYLRQVVASRSTLAIFPGIFYLLFLLLLKENTYRQTGSSFLGNLCNAVT